MTSKDWIITTLPKMDELTSSIILNIIDNIWWDRNIIAHESRDIHVESIFKRIQVSIINFKEAV